MNKLQQTLLPIKLEASQERLTSLAGLIVVEELAKAKGLWGRVNELFPPPGSGRRYAASAYVKPLVWMLQAGGRRLEDLRELRGEQAVLSRLGLEELPSVAHAAQPIPHRVRRGQPRGGSAPNGEGGVSGEHAGGRGGGTEAGCGCDHY